MSGLEFNQLLLQNADFLKPFAVNLTRDTEAANDLYQETLYKALANRDKYNVGTNIKAWLFTIMRNIFINNYRRKAKQKTIFDNTPNEFLINQKQATVSNEAESDMRIKEINAAIQGLPEIFRHLFCCTLTVTNTMKLQMYYTSPWVPLKAVFTLPVNC